MTAEEWEEERSKLVATHELVSAAIASCEKLATALGDVENYCGAIEAASSLRAVGNRIRKKLREHLDKQFPS